MSAPELVVIGASLGGLDALEVILAALPGELSAPVAIAQHRLAEGSTRLADLLRSHSTLPVSEPRDKEPIRAGHVYLAPADYHLLVERGVFSLSTEGPWKFARPSIDVLFESAVDAYRDRVLGVVLTGASEDGADGARVIAQRGGRVLIQDPETAFCTVAPRAALALVPGAQRVPLDQMAARICALCAAPVTREEAKEEAEEEGR